MNIKDALKEAEKNTAHEPDTCALVRTRDDEGKPIVQWPSKVSLCMSCGKWVEYCSCSKAAAKNIHQFALDLGGDLGAPEATHTITHDVKYLPQPTCINGKLGMRLRRVHERDAHLGAVGE